MLRGYTSEAVTRILKEAAKDGAQAAKAIVKPAAPVGTSTHLSQYYRRLGLPHGTLRKAVKVGYIRGRGSMIKGLQGATVGYVIGPMGKSAFTRGWIEYGTRRQRANPWLEKVAGMALAAAHRASENVLERYVRTH